MNTSYNLVLCALGAVLSLGCGGDSSVAPVSGVVTLDGTPVKDATVSFTHAAGGRPAIGRTNASGAYHLMANSDSDKVKVGTHKVAIVAVETSAVADSGSFGSGLDSLAAVQPGRKKAKKKWIVPEVYAKHATSGLEFEVKSGVSNQADFDLSSQQ